MSAKRSSTQTKKAAATAQTQAAVQARNEQLYRRIFILVLLAMVATVILGLGPVWLSAEATRAAQHSQLLKAEIANSLKVSEDLEMQRAAATNAIRMNHTALNELGLVRSTGSRTFIELNASEPSDSAALSFSSGSDVGTDSVAQLVRLTADGSSDPAAPQPDRSFAARARQTLDTAARLTAGEASTLLIGDLGQLSAP
ncbi:MAG: hypothetical protein FWF11_04275 [Coriobacteriia bacterium]|nr:hypothetical protein [Coriobacteriia bacterium]